MGHKTFSEVVNPGDNGYPFDFKSQLLNKFIPPPAPYSGNRSAYFNTGNNQIFQGKPSVGYPVPNAGSWAWWINADATAFTSSSVITCQVDATNVGWYHGLGVFNFGLGDTGCTAPTKGEWHHVVRTFDGTNLYNYIDGVLKDTISQATTIGNSGVPVWLGQGSEGNLVDANIWYYGFLKDVAVFNACLDQSQVSSLYNGGVVQDYRLSTAAPSIMSYWPCGQDTDTVSNIADLGPLNNPLTPTCQGNIVSLNYLLSQYMQGGSGVGSVLNGVTQFTVIAQAARGATSTEACIMGKDDRGIPKAQMFELNWFMGESEALCYVWDNSNGNYTGRILTDGVDPSGDKFWHWIGMTFDGTNVAGYWDGTTFDTDFSSGGFVSMTNTIGLFCLGAAFTSPITPYRPFGGQLVNAMIWSTPLAPTEVEYIMSTLGTFDPTVNKGAYVSAAHLINDWLRGDAPIDVTVSNGVPDNTGNHALTGVNFLDNSAVLPVLSTNVP